MGFSNACDVAFGIFVISWVLTRHVFFMMVCWSIYAYSPVDMAPGCYLSDSTSTTTHFIPASDTEAFQAYGGTKIWGNLLTAYNDRNGPICWNPSLRYYFLALLLTLQVFCLMWFATIARIVYKVISGAPADDLRSDDEGEEDVESQLESTNTTRKSDPTSTIYNAVTVCSESGMSAPTAALKEEEVGVDALTFKRINGTAAATRRQTRQMTRASGISIPGSWRQEGIVRQDWV